MNSQISYHGQFTGYSALQSTDDEACLQQNMCIGDQQICLRSSITHQIQYSIMWPVKNKQLVYMVGINASLGSFLYGYEIANISSLKKLFANANNLTYDQTDIYISIITSAVPFGAIIGAFFMEKLLMKIRHRYLMVILDLFAIFSIMIQCLDLSFIPLFLGRVLVGMIIGLNSGIIPRYIFGITPKQLSGSVAFLTQTMFTVGLTFGYALGFMIDPHEIFQHTWRYFLSVPIITCIIRAINLVVFFPYHMPTEQLSLRDVQKLQRFYYKIYERHNTHEVLRQSRKRIHSQSPQKNRGDMKSQTDQNTIPNYHPPKFDSNLYFFVCMVLTCSNQLCGINAILFYAKQLFLKITNEDQELTQMIIVFLGILQIISSFVGGQMMDNRSKKMFLIVGQCIMAVCLYAIYKLEKVVVMVILLVFVHTIAYRFSVGPLYNYYASKMLKKTSTITITNWSMSFIVALISQFMMEQLGIGNMCISYCIILSLCILVLIKGVPSEMEIMGELRVPMNDKEDAQMSTTDGNYPTSDSSERRYSGETPKKIQT